MYFIICRVNASLTGLKLLYKTIFEQVFCTNQKNWRLHDCRYKDPGLQPDDIFGGGVK